MRASFDCASPLVTISRLFRPGNHGRNSVQRVFSHESSSENAKQSVDKTSVCTGVKQHPYMAEHETPDDVRRWFLNSIEKLWPVALGSISLRKSPCIRQNCSACASGGGHSSYALSGYRGSRRFSVYVPDALAPEIQRAVEKGRRLQDLIKEAGVRYLRARKRAKGSARGK